MQEQKEEPEKEQADVEAYSRQELNRKMKLAKAMGVGVEELSFLWKLSEETQSGAEKLEWYYLCAVDRMPLAELRAMEKGNYSVSRIRKQRQEYLKKIYVALDPMHARIREMETEVKNVCEESRRTKQILEENVGKALEKQYAAQEETMRAKDKTIALLENQVKKLEEEKRLIQDQLSDQEKDMRNAAHLTEQPAAVSGKEDLQDALPEHILRQNFWKKWKGLTQKKISSESKNFIEHYIKDENYTEEQKNFFLDCMEEGMSAEEIAGLASHNLSVDVMKRLKKIEEQRRTRDRKKKKGEKDYGTV